MFEAITVSKLNNYIKQMEYNERESEIVKRAKIVTAVCSRFIQDPDCFDPMPIYLEIVNNVEEFLRNLETTQAAEHRRGRGERAGSSQPRGEFERPRRSTRRPRAIGEYFQWLIINIPNAIFCKFLN